MHINIVQIITHCQLRSFQDTHMCRRPRRQPFNQGHPTVNFGDCLFRPLSPQTLDPFLKKKKEVGQNISSKASIFFCKMSPQNFSTIQNQFLSFSKGKYISIKIRTKVSWNFRKHNNICLNSGNKVPFPKTCPDSTLQMKNQNISHCISVHKQAFKRSPKDRKTQRTTLLILTLLICWPS